MRRREVALLGLLTSACGFPNPNFQLLTESSSGVGTSDATSATTTGDATTDRPTTSDPSTTRGDTDGVTGTSVPTGTTVDPSGDTTSGTSTDTTTDSSTTDPSTGETGISAGDTTTGGGLELPACAAQDLTLRACYDFEYEKGALATKLIDGSMYQHHGGVMKAEVVDGIEGTGLRIIDVTKIEVPSDGKFEWPSQAITMTAWIRPAALPANGNYVGVLHKGPEFGFGIVGGLGLACRVGAGAMEAVKTPPAAVWSHIACVYDNGGVTLYLDGAEVGSGMINDVTLEPSPEPLRFGCGDDVCAPMSRFTGDIDNVRLWSAALKPAVICAQAGNPNCL